MNSELFFLLLKYITDIIIWYSWMKNNKEIFYILITNIYCYSIYNLYLIIYQKRYIKL